MICAASRQERKQIASVPGSGNLEYVMGALAAC
jgi:hypothetical protein